MSSVWWVWLLDYIVVLLASTLFLDYMSGALGRGDIPRYFYATPFLFALAAMALGTDFIDRLAINVVIALQFAYSAITTWLFIRHGRTLGSPVAFQIDNRDFSNWQEAMNPEPVKEGARTRKVTRPRPGHADLAGGQKYNTHDLRDVLERASARETAARTAAGALAMQFLNRFSIRIASHVIRVGKIGYADSHEVPFVDISSIPEDSALHVADPRLEKEMVAAIDKGLDYTDSRIN